MTPSLDNDAHLRDNRIYRIGIVGAGSMGSMMALGFAEQGLDVSLWDINPENVKSAISMAEQEQNTKGKVEGFDDIDKFAKSLEGQERKVLLFSITHGKPEDQTLAKLVQDLKNGDIVLDGGNEHYRNTERRQAEMRERGISWIGMGVSGGYQSARRGPSLSPGGDKVAIELVLPLLEKFAAKWKSSTGKMEPCVTYIGPRGSGHYVKMVHNGIEQGMLSCICEAWALLHKSLRLSNDEIGDVFKEWNSTGELRGNFLIQIGSEICQRRKTSGGDQNGEGKVDERNDNGGYVLDEVLDKVVQDDDGSEGTGYWTVTEAVERHISAPTMAAGHFFRVASGDRAQRLQVADLLRVPEPQISSSAPNRVSTADRASIIEELRKAVYAAVLCSFCQGLELIARASEAEGWAVKLADCIRIWRAGCIIQSDHVADMLEPNLAALNAEQVPREMNPKLIPDVAAALRDNFEPLKKTVLRAVEWDAYVPALSASLEYVKYQGGTMLPTQFMEAQMDFFGAHSYDRPGVKGEDPGKATKGGHHYEWRPA